MPRFELKFNSSVNEGHRGVLVAGKIKRVIYAEEREIALQIGKAMLWETVNQDQFLSALTEVKEVYEGEEYTLCYSSKFTWGRVLDNMGLRPKDVEFVLEENMKGVFEVGFRLKAIELEPIDEE